MASEQQPQQQGALLVRTPADLRALHKSLRQAGRFSYQLLLAPIKGAAQVTLPHPHKGSSKGSGTSGSGAGKAGAGSGVTDGEGGSRASSRACHGSCSGSRGVQGATDGDCNGSSCGGPLFGPLATLVEGVALCVPGGQCYYVELQPGGSAGKASGCAGQGPAGAAAAELHQHQQQQQQQEMAALVRAVLMDADTLKVRAQARPCMCSMPVLGGAPACKASRVTVTWAACGAPPARHACA